VLALAAWRLADGLGTTAKLSGRLLSFDGQTPSGLVPVDAGGIATG
jgi:hypothetical protein